LLGLRVVVCARNPESDAWNLISMLRARRNRPRRHAPKSRDELALPHR
jgi:hypothetical protein